MWEVFSRVLFLVDLFTGVVVLTTCSSTTCLTTCKGDPNGRTIEGGGDPNGRIIEGGG